MQDMFIVFIAAAGAAIAVLGMRHWIRTAREPPAITFLIGVEADFGCGHRMRRTADLRLSDGQVRTRSIPRPDAGRYNCHRCFLETDEEETPVLSRN